MSKRKSIADWLRAKGFPPLSEDQYQDNIRALVPTVCFCEETDMTTDTIQEGDRVLIHVDANGQVGVEGTVSHVPCATGDSWIIQREGWPCVYVQQFHAMWKQKP